MTTAALWAVSLLLLGAAPVLEMPKKFATDRAGVIPAERLAALNHSLAAFERETSNQVLVYVDYGLEGAIPDARAKRITGEVVKPFFKKGDFAGGIEAGAQALMAAARVEGHAGTGRTVADEQNKGRHHRQSGGTRVTIEAWLLCAVLGLLWELHCDLRRLKP